MCFRPISYALTPILPFDASTWLFLFVTMNVCAILYYAIKWISEFLASFTGDNSDDGGGDGGDGLRSPNRLVVGCLFVFPIMMMSPRVVIEFETVTFINQ